MRRLLPILFFLGACSPGSFTIGGRVSHKVFNVTCVAATDDISINWGNGNLAFVDLDVSCDQDAITVNAPTNPLDGSWYTIVIDTGTTGTRDLTWNATFQWVIDGTPPTTTQTADVYDIHTCLYVNSAYRCSYGIGIQ